MKIKLIIAFTAIVSLLLVGCNKDDGESKGNNNNNNNNNQMSQGEWILESWNGSTELSGKVYLDMNKGKFTLYQSINSLSFTIFNGSYTIKDNIITGSYNDSVKWSEMYHIASDMAKTMKLTGVTSGSVAIYTNEKIPEYVKDGTVEPSRSGESVKRFL